MNIVDELNAIAAALHAAGIATTVARRLEELRALDDLTRYLHSGANKRIERSRP